MLKVKKNIDGVDYTTIKDTAEYLGVVQETVRHYINEGKLEVLKFSQRKFYIPVSSVMKLLGK